MTDPVRLTSNADRSKVDMYNQKVIEGFLLEYKKSFHNALLWVKLREKIVKFLRKECPKNSPGKSYLQYPRQCSRLFYA